MRGYLLVVNVFKTIKHICKTPQEIEEFFFTINLNYKNKIQQMNTITLIPTIITSAVCMMMMCCMRIFARGRLLYYLK